MRISLVGKDIWQFPLRHISEEEEERIRTEMERGEWAGGRFGRGNWEIIRKKEFLQIGT